MKAYLLDVEPLMRKGESGLRLFLKTPGGKSMSAFAPFEPYFYLLPSSPDLHGVAKKIETTRAFKRDKQVKAKRVEEAEKSLFGKPTKVLKITCSNPSDVPALREEVKQFGQAFEHNIPFARRFLLDTGLVPESLIDWEIGERTVRHHNQLPSEEAFAKMPPLRSLAFDIETRTTGGVPNPAKEAAIMISYAIGDGKEKHGVITYAKDHFNKKFVKQVKDEKAMLEEFAALVRSEKIDLLAGYNSDEFDLPYLLERSRVLKADFNLGRSKNSRIVVKKLGLRRRARLSGRIHYDVFNTTSRLNFIGAFKFPRLTLGAVYATLTGEEKLDTTKTDIWKTWDAGGPGLSHLLDYSLADALACKKVMEFTLPLDIAAARVTRMPLFEVSRATPGQLVESLLMRGAFERGEIVPNKPDYAAVQARADDAIKGGFVKVPSPGLYENIAVFDFRSLYPSIIVSHNIDPATLNCNCCPGESAHVAPTGARFCKKKKGLVPETLEKVLDERSRLKGELKKLKKGSEEHKQLDARQWALKILANSTYGYLVYARSRYYSRECGEAITAFARKYIQDTMQKAEENGFKVLYGDSITAERYVTIMDSQGFVRIRNIEELFEENKASVEKRGEKEIIRPPGVKALTVDPESLEPKWSVVEGIIRHRTNKRIFRAGQKFGETRVTQDHSLMTFAGGGLTESKPNDLRGKKMARVSSIPAVREVDVIDVYEVLKNYSASKLYKNRIKTATVKCDEAQAWFGWTNRKRTVKVKRFIKVGSKEFESLCRLLGAYIAEGSSSTAETTANRLGASISCGNVPWLESLQCDYLNLFENAQAGIVASNPGIRELTYHHTASGFMRTVQYEDKTRKIQMMNQLSAVFFKMFCGQKSAGKKLPDFIYHVPDKYKLMLIEEMVKGDGSRTNDIRYSEDYVKQNFRYTTKSLQVASGLSLLMTQLGQKYGIKYRPSKKCYTLTTCSAHNSRETTKVTEEEYDGYVYDLAVKDSHMFVDSCGQILLHNTDSCFLQLEKKTREDAKSFMAEVNKNLPGRMELELEDFYPRGIFVGKKHDKEEKGARKKYALINDAGAIKIRGFELVRRDWSAVARNTQRKVLEILLKDGDLKKALALVRKTVVDLREGKVGIAECTIRTQLRKSAGSYAVKSPELGAVQNARAAGKRVDEHALVEYVITKTGKTISEKAQLLELAKDYDADYYVNNQVMPAVLKILGALGVSEEDIKTKSTQKGLGEW